MSEIEIEMHPLYNHGVEIEDLKLRFIKLSKEHESMMVYS